jgi:hypothetical protein
MSLDEVPADHVSQRRAERFRLRTEEENVCARDRHQTFLTSAMSLLIDSLASPNSITVFGL